MAKKHRHYYLDIYGINLHIATTRPQLKDLLKTIKSMDDPTDRKNPPAACTASHFGRTKGAESYHVSFWVDKAMWKRAGARPEALASICAHEATHAAGMIWNHVNANMDHVTLRDDEPIAYLIGWLTEWLFESVKPSK